MWKTLAKVIESTIMIKEEMPIRKKSIARYHQDSNSEKSKDFDENNMETKEKRNKISLQNY